MKTARWAVGKNVDNLQSYPPIIQSAQKIKEDEVVAFPTETVYGLGGNARSEEAVKKIFQAKGRPSDNPLIVHIADEEQLAGIVNSIPEKAKILMENFWPGPLTIIFEKKPDTLSDYVTAGLSTVAVRMPDHQVALAVMRASGLPIAAPSANTSGRPSPTTAKHVADDLDGRIAGIVDGGPTGVGLESTVIDCTEDVPTILRPGGITKEQIEAKIGQVKIDVALANKAAAPKSPGMKYTHYAPEAPFILVDGNVSFIQNIVEKKKAQGLKVGVFTTLENQDHYQADYVLAAGSSENLSTVAAGLYDTLRKFDDLKVDVIIGEVFPAEGIGQAIMNRLLKAAGHNLITEDNE